MSLKQGGYKTQSRPCELGMHHSMCCPSTASNQHMISSTPRYTDVIQRSYTTMIIATTIDSVKTMYKCYHSSWVTTCLHSRYTTVCMFTSSTVKPGHIVTIYTPLITDVIQRSYTTIIIAPTIESVKTMYKGYHSTWVTICLHSRYTTVCTFTSATVKPGHILTIYTPLITDVIQRSYTTMIIAPTIDSVKTRSERASCRDRVSSPV